MQKFWGKRGQTQQNNVAAPDPFETSSKPRAVNAVRKPACWGSSRATGEPEGVCSPPADKIKAVRPDSSPQPVSPGTAQKSAYFWNPFAKDKASPAAAGAFGLQQQEKPPATAKGTYFSAFPILGGQPAASTSKQPSTKEQNQVSTGEQISEVAGRMGNLVVRSMAGGFGWTLGSRAGHTVWNGITRRR